GEREGRSEERKNNGKTMVGTGRFELPTPRTPSECSTRLSHVPTRKDSTERRSQKKNHQPPAEGFTSQFYTTSENNRPIVILSEARICAALRCHAEVLRPATARARGMTPA